MSAPKDHGFSVNANKLVYYATNAKNNEIGYAARDWAPGVLRLFGACC
jgi:hypothetical protein